MIGRGKGWQTRTGRSMGLGEQTLGVETDRDRQGQVLGQRHKEGMGVSEGMGAQHCLWL